MNRLADRVNSLLTSPDGCGGKTLDDCAAELEVSGDALREMMDRQARVPNIAVLAAIVRHYGVDPSWLVNGTYDARTHQMAGDVFHDMPALRALVARVIDSNWRNPEGDRLSGSFPRID